MQRNIISDIRENLVCSFLFIGIIAGFGEGGDEGSDFLVFWIVVLLPPRMENKLLHSIDDGDGEFSFL